MQQNGVVIVSTKHCVRCERIPQQHAHTTLGSRWNYKPRSNLFNIWKMRSISPAWVGTYYSSRYNHQCRETQSSLQFVLNTLLFPLFLQHQNTKTDEKYGCYYDALTQRGCDHLCQPVNLPAVFNKEKQALKKIYLHCSI